MKKLVLSISSILVLALLVAIFLPNYMDSPSELPSNDRAYIALSVLGKVLSDYEKVYGVLPNDKQGLIYLTDPTIDIIKRVPKDPWGLDYVYKPYPAGAAFILYSEGSIINSNFPVILTFKNDGDGYHETEYYRN